MRPEAEDRWTYESGNACRGGCGRTAKVHFRADGWCEACADIPNIIERAMAEGRERATRARRQLKRETAALLRREADRLEREAGA